MPGNLIGRMYNANVELLGPVALRSGRWHVPVILLLVVNEYGRLIRGVNHITIGVPREGQPADEMRVRLERIVIIIEKRGPRRTREDHGVIGAGAFQRLVVAGPDGLDVIRI